MPLEKSSRFTLGEKTIWEGQNITLYKLSKVKSLTRSQTALEQAQEKAETDVDSLVEKETDLYSNLDRPIKKRGPFMYTSSSLLIDIHKFVSYI